jgi:hypothetical protein
MVDIKRRLHQAHRYNSDPPEIIRTLPWECEDEWTHHLAGLITAEGSLGIHVNGLGLLPSLGSSHDIARRRCPAAS